MKKISLLIPGLAVAASLPSICLSSCGPEVKEWTQINFSCIGGTISPNYLMVKTGSTFGSIIRDLEITRNEGYGVGTWINTKTQKEIKLSDVINRPLNAQLVFKEIEDIDTVNIRVKVNDHDPGGSLMPGAGPVAVKKGAKFGQVKAGLSTVVRAKDNYQLKGWEDENGTPISDEQILEVDNQLVIATFEALPSIQVQIKTDEFGEAKADSANVGEDKTFGEIKSFLGNFVTPKDGFVFERWVDANGNDIDDSAPVTAGFVVKALFRTAAFEFELNDDNFTAKVKYYKGDDQSVVIPKIVEHEGKQYKVLDLCDNLFWYDSLMTELVIRADLVSIGEGVFRDCWQLTSISIPDTVKSIGQYAFSRCLQLKHVTIPNGVSRIEYGTFYDCRALTSVYIPETVTYIGGTAFEYCSSLTDESWGQGSWRNTPGIHFGGNDKQWFKVERGNLWHVQCSEELVWCFNAGNPINVGIDATE